MPAPNKVTRKLNDALGSDAGDAMTDWMNGVEENVRDLRGDIAELRQDMNVRFANLREEMASGFADVQVGFAKVDARFAAMDAAAAKRHADFMKWTLGFWAVSLVTLVGAIAGLAQVLR
jgi:hypothetical protein